MFKFVNKLSCTLCKNNSNALVVFGDNLVCRGKAGQAIIRDEPNVFGIPTKRIPSMKHGSFFSDREDEYNLVKAKLIYLREQHKQGKIIILPVNMIGTGLANLENNSPKIFELIKSFYEFAYKNK